MIEDGDGSKPGWRYSLEAYRVQSMGWLRTLVRMFSVGLVAFGGVLLFAQAAALGPGLSSTIVSRVNDLGIPTDVFGLWYLAAGLVLSWLTL